MKEIDERNREPIWPPIVLGFPFVPGFPVIFVPDYPKIFVPDYPKPWEPW
jgi:hypothetical protein